MTYPTAIIIVSAMAGIILTFLKIYTFEQKKHSAEYDPLNDRRKSEGITETKIENLDKCPDCAKPCRVHPLIIHLLASQAFGKGRTQLAIHDANGVPRVLRFCSL